MLARGTFELRGLPGRLAVPMIGPEKLQTPQ